MSPSPLIPLPSSLYIHIPFCKRKCNYCDFVSYAGKEYLSDEYVEALCKEINSPPCQPEVNPPPSLFKRGGKEGGELKTIYFGGGTPTLLRPAHFEKILKAIESRQPIVPMWESGSRHSIFENNNVVGTEHRTQEISIESNPGTADKNKLQELRKLGVNRLSIGAQSFNDRHLKILGRIHDAKTIHSFFDDARKAGFDNINLDLMFALPDQTLEEWQADLQSAIDLKPEHLSIYNLQIEEGTPLHETIWKPCEETDATMFESTINTLKSAGYKHYEISNFAKPGYECQHNINYWRNGNYLGFGAGAHSHVGGKRWANLNSIEEYVNSVTATKPVSSNGNGNGRKPTNVTDTGIVTDKRETIFLGLRLLDGLPKDNFIGFEKEVSELIQDGLLEEKNGNYKLTCRGLFLGNLVFEKFV